MKKIAFLTILALTSLNSCKKDEESTPKNYLKYNGTTYEITKGYLENYGEWDAGMYNFDLTLASEGITVTEEDASGTGNIAYFEILSSSPSDLASGNYTYSSSFSNPGTFDEGIIGLDYDIANEIGTFLELVGGTVKVSKEGNNYDILIDGVLATGKNVAGHYKGTLIVYDYSDINGYKK